MKKYQTIRKSLINSSPQIGMIETKGAISTIISSCALELNGKYINSSSLVALKNLTDLNFISANTNGCYFIFSNIPEKKVPLMSTDGYRCYQNAIIKDGTEYRCLYNGKGNGIRERLLLHLFSRNTLLKIKNGQAKTISGTGAMSLVSLPPKTFEELEAAGSFVPSKHKLKSVKKSIQADSADKREGDLYFLNGIDITEPEWSEYKFAVVVLMTDSEFGKILIEEAFCHLNGRPPLCRRHG